MAATALQKLGAGAGAVCALVEANSPKEIHLSEIAFASTQIGDWGDRGQASLAAAKRGDYTMNLPLLLHN